MGVRIDSLFSELIVLAVKAQFTGKEEERLKIIDGAITVNDVLKFSLYALLELDGIKENHFIELADKLEEVGRMLYGWKNKILNLKENPPQ